jgi:hypothetical protein
MDVKLASEYGVWRTPSTEYPGAPTGSMENWRTEYPGGLRRVVLRVYYTMSRFHIMHVPIHHIKENAN